MIQRCNCYPEDSPAARFQEARYGPGVRVQNRLRVVNPHPPTFRCTVCERAWPLLGKREKPTKGGE